MATTTAPRALAELVESAVPQLKERLLELRVRQAWPMLVGAEVARRTGPQMLSGDTLVVVVDNSPWLQELTLRSAELTSRINTAFPAVRSLRFTVGGLRSETPTPIDAKAARPAPLSEAESREIDQAVETIPDPNLAHAARRLLMSAWRAARPRGDVR
jgi:predicted nucleic acid-binding Zn ribbon protein